jgi:hypothetical protein
MVEPLNNREAPPPPPERVANSMERPALDNRSYRVVKLQNELEALLIHDSETDKASGALDVNVGSFSDTNDMPGLAHAVEHMLFMGTEKVCGHQQSDIEVLADTLVLVPQGKRVQSVPFFPFRLLKCIHGLHQHELLLRSRRLLRTLQQHNVIRNEHK